MRQLQRVASDDETVAVGHDHGHHPHGRRPRPVRVPDVGPEHVLTDIDEDSFREQAEQANANCLVSRALAGVPEIELTARLA
jgi:organic hydroperoxide reductase OsmC/OhrA